MDSITPNTDLFKALVLWISMKKSGGVKNASNEMQRTWFSIPMATRIEAAKLDAEGEVTGAYDF